MGEKHTQPFQLSFNASLKVDFQGSRVTSDGSLILVRELDERLGFSDLIAQHLTDSRGKNTQLPLADLLRQSVYSRTLENCFPESDSRDEPGDGQPGRGVILQQTRHGGAVDQGRQSRW